jgi:hypothetical protein
VKKTDILSFQDAYQLHFAANTTRIPLQDWKKFRYGRDWYRLKLPCFSSHLLRRFDGSFPVQAMEIGIYEGLDLVWLLQNCLKHPDSKVVGIDSWEGDSSIYENASHNLGFWEEQVSLIRARSSEALPTLESDRFDFAIIDGDHKTSYQDAIECRRLVKAKGWIIFDDIRHWNAGKREDSGRARPGLDRFLDEYGDEFDQAWSMGPCECLEKR